MRRTMTALVSTPKKDTIATATASMMQMATAYAMNLKWPAVPIRMRVTTIPMPQRTMVLALRWMSVVFAEERAS